MASTVKSRKVVPSSENQTRLTIFDLCDRWGVSRRTIERRIEDGLIPKPIKLSGLSWFKHTIEEFERTAHE